MSERSYARRRAHALGGAGTTTHRPGRIDPVGESHGGSYKTVSTVYDLQNSTITVQETPNGPIARIEHGDSGRANPEYAGPLNLDTLAGLEVLADA